MPTDLEQVIFNTIRYFDILGMPVTATQIWQCLIVGAGDSHVRWGGHRSYGLVEIQGALRISSWLSERVDTKWGYYMLCDQQYLVRKRLHRHSLAQGKWNIVRRVAPFLSVMPFIRGLAGSGSLALDNTKSSSDLDIFVIAHKGRIWTARLLLLMVSQVFGKRRKYWNEKAPDMFCLNHYVTDDRLSINKEIRNVYTAVLYSSLVPVFGDDVVRKFQKSNASWVRRFVMSPEGVRVSHQYLVVISSWILSVKHFMERLLLEPMFDWVEVLAEKIQRSFMERHWDENRSGRVVLSDCELAFHPNTKAPSIVSAYYQDPGQKTLL